MKVFSTFSLIFGTQLQRWLWRQGRRSKIVVPSGALLVWDSRMPHENFPNDGEDWRMVAWLKKPIASMGCLVYLPTWMVDFHGKCREIYHTWIVWDIWWVGVWKVSFFFGFNGFLQEITPLRWWFSHSKSVLVRCQFFLHPKWESTVCVVYMSVNPCYHIMWLWNTTWYIYTVYNQIYIYIYTHVYLYQ